MSARIRLYLPVRIGFTGVGEGGGVGREGLFYQNSSKLLGLANLEKDGAKMDSKYTYQTVRMCKLVRVFVARKKKSVYHSSVIELFL